MKVSVILPTHNRAHTLARALDSVLAQTRPADEIIVVDDGSDDDTAAVLAAYDGIQLIRQPNRGVSAARNTGIRAAAGDWIALLDSDDAWLPDKLALQEQAISAAPQARLCHGNETWLRLGEPLKQLKKHRKRGGDIFTDCLPLCVISPSAVMLRRDLLDETGLFDENLPACEDYDLWLRICAREPVLYVDTPLLIKHGGHEDQLSRRYWGMDRFRIQALYNLLTTQPLSPSQYAAAAAMLCRKARIFAKGARKHGRPQDAARYEALAQEFDEH
ncbi:glycosyltransferase [Granulosicoccaceae sp. 1_MG-2023]|nr:glycosyltransferase [Granulosicoccaceae sp. 1_MG-2023]